MEKKRIIANWKSNKTAEEAIVFLDTLKSVWGDLPMANKEVIILPSFTSLSAVFAFKEVENLPITLGAQDISAFDHGAYTGEVNGLQISEFAQFVLINHSERRRYNHEADQEARQKVLMAQKYNLTPLFCIQDEKGTVPDNVTEIMYEPPSAISTFSQNAQVESVNEIERVFSVLRQRLPASHLYYGGSVNPQNIAGLASIPNISGFLVGSASLDIEQFVDMLQSW